MPHPPKAACIALAIAAVALPTVPLTTPASAATSAQCTRYTASPPVAVGGGRTKTATLSGCSPFSATGGSGYAVTDVTTHVTTVTWVGGNGTTIVKGTYKGGPKPNKCPSGSHLTISGGTVTGGSGTALGTIKVGNKVSARLCVRPTLAASLEPGSTFKFAGAAPTVPSGNSPPPAVPLPAAVKACPAGTIGTMVGLVNRDRKRTGNLPPLAENANLDWAARKHSIMMATKTGPSHENWDREIAESRFVAGPPYAAGQNIAVGPEYYPLDLVEAGFFDEKPPHDGHRLNILNKSFHKIGIGCVINKSNGLWSWTQNFGS